ncbi:MAG: ParB/RepB/Spo0J family partition protein [Oenococcus sp.]|uniref:ParB/RepB/Spo0J family partition protein n=1 Tax=Oenococcus TaxID=46254 RepID=UPI0021E7B631|nr:ParB/RepB/Spo0J family partition protein [Oenococcus kitaharae]MCV3296260.1 ParB/RepB/Spo0J family partition protein [Oenococcus kitaharae]
MANKRGLGRGIDALFSDEDDQKTLQAVAKVAPKDTAGQSLLQLKLSSLEVNPYQPRKIFDQTALTELAQSLKQTGLIEPLIVRKHGSSYQIIAGERRFRAAKLAGLTQVPVIEKTLSDSAMIELAIIENLQRENLNPIEEAQGINSYMKELALTQSQVAEKLGKSRAAITNTLRLLNLPEAVQQFMIDGRLAMGHARALLGLDTPAEMVALANRIVSEGLSVRQVEELVRGQSQKQSVSLTKKHSETNIYAEEIEKRLEDKFSTKVSLSKKKLEISFSDQDELNRILEILGVNAD